MYLHKIFADVAIVIDLYFYNGKYKWFEKLFFLL